MSSLHGFIFEKGLKEMFSQIHRSAGRVPRVRKRKSRLGLFTLFFSISNAMKSDGKINLSTFTSTSSITPRGCFNDLSARCRVTVVGLASPNPNRLNMDKGMRLILAPKSHRVLSKIEFPILQGIVKLPRSFNFYGNFL